eukprot:TRINITY_DN4887_c0_g1_i15.p2 TRINITY_DN4887_c0_g1~~TRINITY_DN4887_c0_g1_i15.p2  ORF type:complete len:213 (+),score=25.69 TRINITY_DN4887_c0_g1_i15:175-813(+)
MRGSEYECEEACKKNPRCQSFARCNNRCFLKDRRLKDGEPWKRHRCKSYYNKDLSSAAPSPALTFGVLRGLARSEGNPIGRMDGSEYECEEACKKNPKCQSFARCRNRCFLKDRRLKDGEPWKRHRCKSYYNKDAPSEAPSPALTFGVLRGVARSEGNQVGQMRGSEYECEDLQEVKGTQLDEWMEANMSAKKLARKIQNAKALLDAATVVS